MTARELATLQLRLAVPPTPALRRWAAQLSVAGGPIPLLGMGLSGPRYESLLWNGARCPGAKLLVTGLLCADPATRRADLDRALAAGTSASAVARAAARPSPALASIETIGCAVVAAVVAGLDHQLNEVVDLAASLMILSPAAVVTGPERMTLVRAGHPVASGWLAVRLLLAGIVAMPDAVGATLDTLAGPRPHPDEAGPVGPATIGELLTGLGAVAL
jgi:hypothetical protein